MTRSLTDEQLMGARSQARNWLLETVCNADPRLNRAGAICPCLSDCLDNGKLEVLVFGVPDGEFYERKDYARTFLRGIKSSLESNVSNGTASAFDCVLIAIEGLEAAEVRGFMDSVYLECRGEFLSEGYMFGSFHPYNKRHSRLNKEFFPMRTQMPMFAIRRLSRADERNLKNEPEYFALFQEFFNR